MAQNTKGNKKQNKQQNKKDKAFQKKKGGAKSHSSVCPYILGIFVLIGAIGFAIGYDYNIHGGVFEKSSTGKLLKDIGALPYVEIAWYKTMSNSARGYKWLEQNTPVYYELTRKTLDPYFGLMVDVGKVALGALRNFGESIAELFVKKGPVVSEFVDQYIPGFSKTVTGFFSSAWTMSVDTYHASCDFFKTKIFIGSLSPESLNIYVNNTKTVAAKYYFWFHQKVDDYAKIK